jgi:ATP-dependent helicase YprA (DUF1998 family)
MTRPYEQSFCRAMWYTVDSTQLEECHIQSPKCGSGNKPLDKQAAVLILQDLVQGVGKKRPQ